jgi:hypothetical protein
LVSADKNITVYFQNGNVKFVSEINRLLKSVVTEAHLCNTNSCHLADLGRFFPIRVECERHESITSSLQKQLLWQLKN